MVQVIGTGLESYEGESAGGVLVLDRRTRIWRAIYDIPPGGSKRSDFRVLGMAVNGDRLFAHMCYSSCGHWGSYSSFLIDLHTFRRTLLEEPLDGLQNPTIHDLEAEVFSAAAYPYG